MSSLGNIVNPRAPVRCYARGSRVGEMSDERREFSCLAEFLKWYAPRHHGDAPLVNSQYLFTDVMLDRLTDCPRDQRGLPRGGSRGRARVEVDGMPYKSVYDAFCQLGLPVAKHAAFRKGLRAAGSGEFHGHKFRVL